MAENCKIYTPDNWVGILLDEVGYKSNLYGKRVLENSCGTGNILRRVVERYIIDAIAQDYSLEDIKNGLEQDIIGADNNKYLPIEIKRFYSSVNPAYSNCAGIGSKWNYESNIIYADGFILWKMFDGTEKRFIQSDPLITSGEYQKWIDTSAQNNSDNISSLC